jgi:hypothetical protein
MKMFPSLLAGVLALGCVGAMAQWQWLDKDGRKVFSDRAPPPDVADKSILKRPGEKLPAAAASSSTHSAEPTSAAASQSSTPPAPPANAGVDKDLEAKKKQLADAELAKRKAEEDRFAKSKADNCLRAKQSKASMDSGIRLSRVNANGEREFLDDAARDVELKRLQAIMDSDCK